jgi:hypothetical protein
MPKRTDIPPVSAIIGVLPRYEDEALSRFRKLGFEPSSVTRNETEIKFYFRLAEDKLHELASAIPLEFHAKRAIVGGSPFGNS